MTTEFSLGEEPPVDLLVESEGWLREAAEDLVRARRALRSGKVEEVKAAQAAIREMKTALDMAMQERARIDRLRNQAAGIVGDRGRALDFDAARLEIGRRLACLRDAGDG
ncbi:MAG: hypothetical protein DI533_03630 [Cereibacter sphaeroides]|uniref:Uncharacterized protein n=1 Tax=Cereibacter sphaeroides TaxID=1063 RepID=A0A2W5SNM0_CERSP|nr:MAG: hypothetical protein DI533_03630 [Cereibacter sphaeroides]